MLHGDNATLGQSGARSGHTYLQHHKRLDSDKARTE